MYKDKAKQREAGKERQRRYRDKQKPIPEVTPLGNIRVSKPGDSDYEPQCETTRAFIESAVVTKADRHVDASDITMVKALHQVISKPKRGKDIKCFDDLPPDVQATINRVSESNEEKAKRTAAAIKYQHLFPNRYNSTGVA